MTPPGDKVLHLQLLLRPAHRGAEPARAVAQRARALGLTVTGVGQAALTVTATAAELRKFFPRLTRSRLSRAAELLDVPPALKDDIESISIAPMAKYF